MSLPCVDPTNKHMQSKIKQYLCCIIKLLNNPTLYNNSCKPAQNHLFYLYSYLMKNYNLYFIVLGLLINFNSYSQINLTDFELNLISKSLEKSYELKSAKHELSIDSIEHKTIKQHFIPTLSLDAIYGYSGSRINLDIPTTHLPITGIDLFEGESQFDAKGQVFNTNLTAKLLLFSGLQVNYGSKATEEKIKAKNFMLVAKESDIIKDVIGTFDKIELLHKAEDVISSSETRLKKEKERVTAAIKNGLAIPYDRQKITAAELNLASKKAELYGNLSLLYFKLSMLTDVSVSELENYQFNLNPWLFKNNSKTYQDRPELNALDASINAYDYKLRMNKNAYLPKVQAFATLSYANLFNSSLATPYSIPGGVPINLEINKFEMFPAYMLGVGMHWDIFSGFKNSNKTSKTSIEKTIAEDEKDDIEEKLALFAKKVQVDFEVKNQQILFKEQEKEVALNTLNLGIKSYREGLISITERLQSETEYQNAVLNYYKLIAQQRSAAIELLISTGSLKIENLKN